MRGAGVRVPFRHSDRGVTEDLLQVVDIPALHHELRGERVPQIMETDQIREARLLLRNSKIAVEMVSIDRRAVLLAEHELALLLPP